MKEEKKIDLTTTRGRLKAFIDHIGISEGDFESDLGISNGYVSNIRKGIGAKVLPLILNKYPQLNRNWLVYGEGNMRKDETSILQVSGEIHKAPNGRFPKKTNGNDLIKFYDTDFAMGQIDFIDDVNTIKPAYVMDIPEFAGCTAFRGYSESMMPLITPGAILFGMRIEEWRSHLEPGQVYGIVMTDRRRYLKYIRRSVHPLTHYLLRSENPDFDDFEIPMKDIKSIWLIYGWMNKRV